MTQYYRDGGPKAFTPTAGKVFFRLPRFLRPAIQTLDWIWRWGMVEVFFLGALLSMVKLTQLASVHIGIALYAVGAYVLLLSAAVAAFDPHSLWRRVEELRA